MAFGQFTDYRDAGDGTTSFGLADGQRLSLFGPEAEDLKRRIDATNATAPQPTAGLSFDQIEGVGGYGGTASAAPQPPPVASDVAAPTPGVDPQAAAMTQALASQQGQAAQQEQAAPQPQIVGSTPSGGMIERWPDGTVTINERARAGTRGGPVEVGRTIQGGVTDPEQAQSYRDAQSDVVEQQQNAQDLSFEAERQKAGAERAFIEEQLAQAQAQATEAQRIQEEVAARVTEARSNYSQREQEFADARVDPNRIMSGGKNWIYALAGAMGTFGAVLSKSPNFAMQFIQDQQAADISAQEREIAVKGEAADNALSSLVRETGDLQQAKLELGALQTKRASAEMSKMAASTSDAELKAKYAQAAAALDEQHLRQRMALDEIIQGNVTRSIRNVAGTAGSRGGRRLATIDEQKEVIGLDQAEANVGKAVTDIAKTRQDLAGSTAPGAKKAAESAQGVVSAADSTMKQLQELAAAHGGTFDPRTGELVGASLPTDVVPGLDSEATTEFKTRARSIGTSYANALVNNGAELGENAKAQFVPDAGITENTTAKLQALYKDAMSRKRAAQQQLGVTE